MVSWKSKKLIIILVFWINFNYRLSVICVLFYQISLLFFVTFEDAHKLDHVWVILEVFIWAWENYLSFFEKYYSIN